MSEEKLYVVQMQQKDGNWKIWHATAIFEHKASAYDFVKVWQKYRSADAPALRVRIFSDLG
jgi:hypothetical protein